MYDPYIDVVFFITKEIIIVFTGIGTLLKAMFASGVFKSYSS